MISSNSDSSSFLFLVKQTSQANDGKWHLVQNEGDRTGICGYNISLINERVGYRKFNLEKHVLDERAGLGDVCKDCREYITGSLSDHNLPKPEKATNKIGTGASLVDSWKRSVEEVEN